MIIVTANTGGNSVAVAICNCNIVVSAILVTLFLKVPLTPFQISGIVIIIAGTIVMLAGDSIHNAIHGTEESQNSAP